MIKIKNPKDNFSGRLNRPQKNGIELEVRKKKISWTKQVGNICMENRKETEGKKRKKLIYM